MFVSTYIDLCVHACVRTCMCGVYVCVWVGGVVWCGVVWCGVVWCGVVWCGVVWCGVVWCGVVWCGVVWCVYSCKPNCISADTVQCLCIHTYVQSVCG